MPLLYILGLKSSYHEVQIGSAALEILVHGNFCVGSHCTVQSVDLTKRYTCHLGFWCTFAKSANFWAGKFESRGPRKKRKCEVNVVRSRKLSNKDRLRIIILQTSRNTWEDFFKQRSSSLMQGITELPAAFTVLKIVNSWR